MKNNVLQPTRIRHLLVINTWFCQLIIILLLSSIPTSLALAQGKLWDKRFGGNENDRLSAMLPTADGGYLLGGDSYAFVYPPGGDKSDPPEFLNDYWVVKINSSGTKMWDRVFGGSEDDNLKALIATPDGGYILGGSSGSGISGDKSEAKGGYWVVKIDGNGNKVWDKAFGGSLGQSFTSIVATADGGYILGGTSNSGIGGDKSEESRGESDYWIVKISSSGNKVWDKSFGGSSNEILTGLVAVDGGYLLSGSSVSGQSGDKSQAATGCWVVKIDGEGNKIWDRTHNGGSSALVTTPDGGYLLGGTSNESGGNYWIVKIDANGNKVWDKTLGGSGGDALTTMIATSDGGYLLGGFSFSDISGDKTEANRGDYDYWVVKIDGNGAKIWDKTFGGDKGDILQALVAATDGTYLLGGFSSSDASGDKTQNNWYLDEQYGVIDYWVVKLDDSKKSQTITFDPIPDKQIGDAPFTLSATASSGLPVTFSIQGPATISGNTVTLTGVGIVVVKASQAGDATYFKAEDVTQAFLVESFIPLTKQWDKTLGGSELDELTAMIATPDGGYLVGGTSRSDINGNISGDKSQVGKGREDYWIIKIDASGAKVWDKTVGGSDYDHLSSIVPTLDGGYLLSGGSASGQSGDKSQAATGCWVVKIDGEGNKIWDRTHNGGSSVLVTTPDGGYLLGGTSNESGGNYWIVKIDANGNKVWDKTFGGSKYDALTTMIATSDGGYLLGGHSISGISGDKSQASKGDNDYWVVKLDASGNKVWDKALGGSAYDYLSSIILASDSGYLLGGYSNSGISGDKTEANRDNEYSTDDYWVIKLDANGNKVWDKTLGGSDRDYLSSMVSTPDGGYLLGGSSESNISGDRSQINRGEYTEDGIIYFLDYWLVKLDASGNKLWDRVYGGDNNDYFKSLISTLNGGYLLGGYSISNQSSDKSEYNRGWADYWIIKVKENVPPPPPVSSWDKRYGGKSFERLTSVVKTNDGGYLLGGHSLSRHGGDRSQDTQGRYDYWIVKTDATGAQLWDKRYGGSDDDYLNQIIVTADGGYLLAGSSQSGLSGDKSQGSRGNQDFWIVKISSSGAKQWDRSYGGSGFEDLMQAVQLSTGEYVLAGVSASDISGEKSQNRRGSRDYWLVKISATGAKLWDKRYGGSKAERLGSLVATADGGFILGGSSDSGQSGDKSQASHGQSDYWLVQVSSQGELVWEKSFGGSGQDELTALVRTTSGELLLAGHSTSGISGDKSQPSRGSSDYWLVQTNAQGEKQWDRTYGGNAEEELGSLISTQDGGWLIGGSSFSNISGEKSQNSQGSSDYWAVKLDAQGEKQWDQTYGGAGEEKLRYLLQTEDNGYLLGGFSFSNQSGDKSQASQGRSDYWIVKIPPLPATQARMAAHPEVEAITPAGAGSLKAYPIPAKEKITVQFTLPQTQLAVVQLYNSQGAKVKTLFQGEALANKAYQVDWQPSNQQGNGLYFLQLRSKNLNKSLKILLER